MAYIVFVFVALLAIFLSVLSSQGFFNVSDDLLWRQTRNLLSKEEPIRMEIPSVRINSSTDRIGIDKNGVMEAPASASIIGWYQFGALPGEKGNLVFSAHKDSQFGPGVFYTLNRVKPGDSIIIQNAQNEYFTYVAKAVDSYVTQQLPIDRIFEDQTQQKKIYLITCDGTFNFFTQKYDKRILVEGTST